MQMHRTTLRLWNYNCALIQIFWSNASQIIFPVYEIATDNVADFTIFKQVKVINPFEVN